VPAQIIKIFFLLKNVGLRRFFASCEAPQDDWAFEVCGELGATGGVDTVGLAVSALLRASRGRSQASGERNQNRQDGRSGIVTEHSPCRAILHRCTSRHRFWEPGGQPG
jgi:hypothetical protein